MGDIEKIGRAFASTLGDLSPTSPMTWIQTVKFIGVPAAMALFLLLVLLGIIPTPLTKSYATTEDIRTDQISNRKFSVTEHEGIGKKQDEGNFYLKGICLGLFKNDLSSQREFCTFPAK